jgi:hypothetical protein
MDSHYRTEHARRPGLSALVNGIFQDAKDLVVQGATLAKLEVKDELRKAKSAVIAAGVGLGISALGGVFIILMIVHALAANTDLPLWGSYGVVGGVLVVLGAALFVVGKSKVAD